MLGVVTKENYFWCMNRFKLVSQNGAKPGRPWDVSIFVNFQRICDSMEVKADSELHTLAKVQTLHSSDLSPGYIVKCLKWKLLD